MRQELWWPLVIAGGVLYAYDTGYFNGIYVEGYGIGLNGGDIPTNPRMIEWNGGACIRNMGGSNVSLAMESLPGGEVRMDAMDANDAGARVQANATAAALRACDDNYDWTSFIEALPGGTARMRSLNGNVKVEATSGGDVVITLPTE